jgi:hypothetical protein
MQSQIALKLYIPRSRFNVELEANAKVRLMLSRLDDPHFCLARAKEVQTRAETVHDGVAKVLLLELAEDFLRLAKFAVDRRKKEGVAGGTGLLRH